MRLLGFIRTGATVVVLGMHRSGTSMIAGVVQALGVHVGDELLPAYASNPLGHFEAKDIVELNDRILADAGGSWNNPPLPKDIARAARRYTREIRRMIRSRNRDHTTWGWKDPRTALTFPVYYRYLRNPRVIVCQRNCGAVARSLAERDKSEYEDNVELCREYGARIRDTLSRWRFPRLVLGYDVIRQSPIDSVRRIDSFIGTNAPEQSISAAASMILDETELKLARSKFDDLPSL